MIPNRKKTDVFADVAAFTELAQPNMLVPIGTPPSQKAIELAIGLVEEECNKEYIPALREFLANPSRENAVKVLDGGLDTIYVIAWAFRVFNLPANAGWNEVQRSNMAKFPLATEANKQLGAIDKTIDIEVNYRQGHIVMTNAQTGKVVKPEGWTPPNLAEVMLGIENIHKIRTMPNQISTTVVKEYFDEIEGRRERGEIDL